MRDKKIHPKLTLTIAAILVVLVALTAFVWAKQIRGDKTTSPQSTATVQQEQPAQQDKNVSYAGEEGKNALELLKTKADVVTKQSAYGEYVDSINGVQGGTDGKYWAFYVNGQMAQVGAADYQTKNEDRIEWKFE